MPRMRSTLSRLLMLLAIGAAARADLCLADGKLSLDAVVWAGSYLSRGEQAGFSHNAFTFERPGALVGVTGRLSSPASFRASGDFSILQPRDLYVDLRWSSGFGLRAGQFLLPLGMDAMTEPDSQKTIGSSFLANYAKPAGIRDIGLLGGWESNRYTASFAIVNGAGANASDYNSRKDACGRVAVNGLGALTTLALRAYYGYPNAPDSAWRSLALEARVRRGPLEVQTEIQNLNSEYVRNNMAYLLVVWDAGIMEPVGRFDLILAQGMRAEWMGTVGLNTRHRSDHLQLMLDCSYHRNYQYNWSFVSFDARLRLSLYRDLLPWRRP